jgi:hypothetical protein
MQHKGSPKAAAKQTKTLQQPIDQGACCGPVAAWRIVELERGGKRAAPAAGICR